MDEFKLPPVIRDLIEARNAVREHYKGIFRSQGSPVDLRFTLDGNLVGDLGEALAAELFGVKLLDKKGQRGIDGYAPSGKSVQVKASGTRRGAAFRKIDIHADHLLVFCLDFESELGSVIFNGPEKQIWNLLPKDHQDQRMVSHTKIIAEDLKVIKVGRLIRIQ